MYHKSIRIRCIYCIACFIRNDLRSGTSFHNNPTKIKRIFRISSLFSFQRSLFKGNMFHAVRSHFPKPTNQNARLTNTVQEDQGLRKTWRQSWKIPPILLIGDTSIQSSSMFACHVTLPEGNKNWEKKWQFFFRKRRFKKNFGVMTPGVLHHDGSEFLPERFHSWFFTSEIHKLFQEVLNNSWLFCWNLGTLQLRVGWPIPNSLRWFSVIHPLSGTLSETLRR